MPAPKAGESAPKSRILEKKKVQTNNLMHYGENNRDKDRQETQE